MSRILAIDYGSVRIGLALTDPLGILAQPIAAMKNRGKDEVVEELKKIIVEKDIHLVLIGLARKLDGTLGTIGEESLRLSEELKKECHIEVKLCDETFTSREAEEILIGKFNLSREKRRAAKDSLAAALMLKGFLRG